MADNPNPNQSSEQKAADAAKAKATQDAEREKLKAELRKEIEAEQKAQAKAGQSEDLKKAKAEFKMPEGEEGYTHVRITQLNGQVLEEPQIKAFDPHQYETSISKQAGFKADVLHKGKVK
ncbi:hypothetical protein [Hymenobacter koreensis]|uniref:Uncharacterized protein n=1 Tax=Hymenobacter koreensis TaxID=1084523 RepID=A0ABP8JNC2_9BACT